MVKQGHPEGDRPSRRWQADIRISGAVLLFVTACPPARKMTHDMAPLIQSATRAAHYEQEAKTGFELRDPLIGLCSNRQLSFERGDRCRRGSPSGVICADDPNTRQQRQIGECPPPFGEPSAPARRFTCCCSRTLGTTLVSESGCSQLPAQSQQPPDFSTLSRRHVHSVGQAVDP